MKSVFSSKCQSDKYSLSKHMGIVDMESYVLGSWKYNLMKHIGIG